MLDVEFIDGAGNRLTPEEVEAEGFQRCDVHFEWYEGHCPKCCDGYCEGCEEEIPVGKAALREYTTVWCRRCVDKDIRESEGHGRRAPQPAPAEPVALPVWRKTWR